MPYLSLVSGYHRILAFGFALTFFSSFGQTFFIALFSRDIRDEFGLSHGSFGAVYSLATLASGLSIIWAGGAIDRFPLRRYTRAVVLGLAGAAVLFATAKTLALLFAALYLLRLFGQGLMGHTAMTTVSRVFAGNRGKAMSVAALGFPAGEAVLPTVFVALTAVLGREVIWWIVAAGVVAVLWPLVEWQLRTMSVPRPELPEDGESESGGESAWTRRAVLGDRHFYFVLPAVLAPPFIITGLFFHQIAMVEAKGWTMEWFAASFSVYALSQVVSSLVAGPLVDRISASRLLGVYLVPMAAACCLLWILRHPLTAWGFMIAAGFSGGTLTTIVGSYWAEAYGVRHLGSIRSLVTALMVFSTAASPVLLGKMIDAGVTFEQISLLCLIYVLGASILAGTGRRRSKLETRAT